MWYSGNGRPIRLAVTLSDAAEVEKLRARTVALSSDLEQLQVKFRALEFQYQCELSASLALRDLLRAHKIPYP